MYNQKKVLFITTGGTIVSSVSNDGTVTPDEKKNTDIIVKLLASTRVALQKQNNIEIEIFSENFFEKTEHGAKGKDSSDINPDDWTKLVDIIVNNYEAYDAFIITHGTNTLGYTSSALSFALGGMGKPVILTGSQVPLGFPGSDATINLENSLRVAVSSERRLHGVFVVFGSHIITGVRAKKISEFAYDSFRTFSLMSSVGRIGRKIDFNKASLAAHHSFLDPVAEIKDDLLIINKFDTRIASFTEFPGMSYKLFESVVENDSTPAKGIILRSFGAGDPSIDLLEGFKYLHNKKIPIIVTTQAPDGISSMRVNGPGRRVSILGAIPAWNMSMEAMVTKLAWLLGRELSYEEIRRLMGHSNRGEITLNY